MSFKIQPMDLAGFDLAGQRQSDGTIKFYGNGRIIEEWPKEIRHNGATYTLEDVAKGEDGYESGIYV